MKVINGNEITINTEKMPYSPPHIECLRFGGRIGGIGIGCCGVDIFQGFSNDPNAPATVQLYNGDSPHLLIKGAILGPTNLDVFKGYLRVGTFSDMDEPNRAFLAVMTDEQLSSRYGFGKQWLQILKENGFEFIRSFDNSVYSGSAIDIGYRNSHVLHMFGLFRNIGNNKLDDPFTPPSVWTDLPEFTGDLEAMWRADTIHNYLVTPIEEEEEEGPVKANNPFLLPA